MYVVFAYKIFPSDTVVRFAQAHSVIPFKCGRLPATEATEFGNEKMRDSTLAFVFSYSGL
jgi:hypothetical protein